MFTKPRYAAPRRAAPHLARGSGSHLFGEEQQDAAGGARGAGRGGDMTAARHVASGRVGSRLYSPAQTV